MTFAIAHPARIQHLLPLSASRSGFSMLGLLVTMVCIVILFAILTNSLNIAVTGGKTQQRNTVRSFEDQNNLRSLAQAMLANADEFDSPFITPSGLAQRNDSSLNTTANLFSAMVMKHYTTPEQLISGNEYSGYVKPLQDYNYEAYNPAAGVFWDRSFQADLAGESNVSYAHMPLCGERFDRYWRHAMNSTVPIIGNRGPKDGECSPMSRACGSDGVWRGHLVFGDGHIDFVESPLLSRLSLSGTGGADNIFKMESGPGGSDAILSFTQSMSGDGPTLQFD